MISPTRQPPDPLAADVDQLACRRILSKVCGAGLDRRDARTDPRSPGLPGRRALQDIVGAKLRTLMEEARLASQRLFA